jgi:hypothetical protein
MPDEGRTMSEVAKLREEAERAKRWARAITDARLVERLLDLAQEYARRADELQRRPLSA